MVAVCEGGSCRLGFVVKWVWAKGDFPCNSRPTIAEPTVSDPDASALLNALALRLPTDGIYGVTAPARCLTDGRQRYDRCRQLVGVQKVDKRSSAAALAAIEDDWRRRQHDGIELENSYSVRFLSSLTIATIFFSALPWLLTAAWAMFNRFRIGVCSGASALLGGIKLAAGVWMPPIVLGCLLMSLWLPGLMKSRKPWGLSRTVLHLLAMVLQVSFALWLYINGSESRFSSAPPPEIGSFPTMVGTVILLIAAVASGGYVVVAVVKALIRLLNRHHPITAG